MPCSRTRCQNPGHGSESILRRIGTSSTNSSSVRSLVATSTDLGDLPHVVFSVVLPVDIHSTSATYDTQFGLIERPTHRNTTVDQAKFEVVAHRFADLSEAGYGVSLGSKVSSKP